MMGGEGREGRRERTRIVKLRRGRGDKWKKREEQEAERGVQSST